MQASSRELLKLAVPLVRTHGFTRDALARSVLSLPQPHAEPLSDSAVSALFGSGNAAQKTLINAWLDEGLQTLKTNANGVPMTVSLALHTRLSWNEPVLEHLPEAFALLASPESGIPPLDPLPALKHTARVADEAAYLSKDKAIQLEWHARRASLAMIYGAAELHQLSSPETAHSFLDSLLVTSSKARSALGDVATYGDYVARSWVGLIKSSGVFA
ncbi:hypothetical protein BD626DRAFT_491425 [Schizophyllum amplum]|uniref:COQ9 C-terminal domain-containing protein n=1 Tax=Schizophyllum amplum TaxID=97359 RepID=A0A550CHN0_9AGAR|nr:hypothetical protein BD626DRAFT_491425 [Auriculariopsis ampla]